MNKILLIDDDYEFATSLEEVFNIDDFNVLITKDWEEILNLLDDSIDLLLLNIKAPEKNIINTIKKLRRVCQTPIIILTAQGNEQERVLSLELGADDYLFKPVNSRELIARIRSIFRCSFWREHHRNRATLVVDSLSLNPGRQEANFNGKILDLTGTEFTLLYLLAKNLGQVVSRDLLSQMVLGKRLTPFDRAIDMHISNLRHKLPKRRDGHPWFKTLRGRGYLMVSTS